MKLAQILPAGELRPRVAVQVGAGWVDLAIAAPHLPADIATLLSWPDGPRIARAAALTAPPAALVDTASAQWLPPVTRPGKIICLGLNFGEHAREGGHALPQWPSFFLRGAHSLVGHRAQLVRPRVSEQLDYEAELAVVIGRRCRHLSEADALAAVAGYACFNDASVRDYQKRSSQWTWGKNFDGTGSFGPWIVTADDLPPGAHGLRIEARLNGRTVQRDTTAEMLFPVARTLALITEAMTLEPGDVLAMGTPAGVGQSRRPPQWLRPGDEIEVEIEGIGVLANRVRQEEVDHG